VPIRRKICHIGGSKAVFLPKSWVDLLEEKYGKIEAVSMEVNGKLTIRPLLKEVLRNEKKEQRSDNNPR
jgi:antitoxin component of MazEF toxin-antitoxin module